MKSRPNHAPRGAFRQRGLSLIELMVAMLIGLFLLGGLLSILQSTRNTSSNQALLSQLQDNERIAMSLMTSVIESAGYYPSPETVPLATALPSSPDFAQPGQIIVGSANTNGPGDAITVRYGTAPNDGVLLCDGTSNTTTGNVVYENTFELQTDKNGKLFLACILSGGPAVKLVSGIQNMQIYYGVNSAATAMDTTEGVVDSYLTAGQMTPTNWTNVYSVKVVLTFANPLAGQPGQTGAAKSTVTFTRVIGVMSRIGVDVVNFI
jgi:type IV pilus assembly protein PilW